MAEFESFDGFAWAEGEKECPRCGADFVMAGDQECPHSFHKPCSCTVIKETRSEDDSRFPGKPRAARYEDPKCPVHGRPERCPTCESDDPAWCGDPYRGLWVNESSCPDPWHLHGEREPG